MKKGSSKSTERKAQSQRSGSTPNKKRKSTSFTQGDRVEEDFEDMLMELNLKKPKRAFNFFIAEIMDKDSKVKTLTDATKAYAKKWSNLSSSERKKYEDQAEKDQERYETHLELVKKHILNKPLKEGATAYRIFLEDYIRKAMDNNEDLKEAKKEASAKWKDMTPEEKKEWNEKKKEHAEYYEDLKKSRSVASAYQLYIRDQMIKAKEKGERVTFNDVAAMWTKAKTSVKEKYQEYADQLNEERTKQRDIYEIAFGLKPRKPLGAFKFFLMEAAKEGKFQGKNPFSEGKRLWEKLSEENKEKYQRMAQKEKLAYMLKKMEYESHVRKTSSVRPVSAFNIFCSEQKGKIDTKDLGRGGFFEACNKKWNKMDDGAKKKYYDKAEKEKKESDKLKDEISSRVYDAPKRPGNNYNIYLKTVLPELQKENPKKEVTQLFKMVADKWNALSDKQKEKYSKLAEKDFDTYKQHMKDFESQGYYSSDKVGSSGRRRASSKSRSQSASTKKGKKSVKE